MGTTKSDPNDIGTVRCHLNGTICNTLRDSGASCCIIDNSSIQNFPAAEIRRANKTFLDASGNNMKIIGSTMLEVRPMGLTESRRIECFVTDSESHRCILLGRKFMRLFQRITFDFENQRVTFGDKWYRIARPKQRVRSTN